MMQKRKKKKKNGEGKRRAFIMLFSPLPRVSIVPRTRRLSHRHPRAGIQAV